MTVVMTRAVMPQLLASLVFLAAPTLVWAGEYDLPSFPGDAPPAAVPSSSCLDKPIEKLAADPRAAAVIDKDIPGLLGDTHYPIFKSMSLRTVAALSSGRISQGTLSEIDQELDAPSPAASHLRK